MNKTFTMAVAIGLTSALLSMPVLGQAPRVETGEIEGAPFRIQIPKEWNRNLVMYAHAYLPAGAQWTPLADVLATAFLERGFALAESGYSRQGWALAEAVKETEALRQHFVDLYGEPDSTFVAGHSMGGLVTLATIETYPDFYVGALPMCSPMVPAIHFFKDPVLDMLVTFEALFGAALPKELRPLLDMPKLPQPVLERALESDPTLAGEFARHWGVRRGELAGILALYHQLYQELAGRAGGNPIDNSNTVYSGFDSVEGLNRLVPRYTADPMALAYVRQHYTPTGAIKDPVLAVHTTYDPGVPPRLPSYYDVIVSLNGNQDLFVQKYVEADGHCSIDPALMGRAFDELRAWTATGAPPEPGLLN
jgi:pimeloyl-ACP methyl ester carboxylesterase